jgi:hypothetical protein
MTTTTVYAVVRATVDMAVVSRGMRGDFSTRTGAVKKDIIGVIKERIREMTLSMRANGYVHSATDLVISAYAVHTVKCAGRTKTGTKARNGTDTAVCVHRHMPAVNGKSMRHIRERDMIRGAAEKLSDLDATNSIRDVDVFDDSTPRLPCLLLFFVYFLIGPLIPVRMRDGVRGTLPPGGECPVFVTGPPDCEYPVSDLVPWFLGIGWGV